MDITTIDPQDQKKENKNTDDKKASKPKQSERIVAEVKKEIKLFIDERGDAYAQIKNDGHYENWPVAVRNKKFKTWIARIGRRVLRVAPSESSVKESIVTLEGDALFGTRQEYELFNRAGIENTANGKKYWYDLANPQWSAIEITAAGWKEVTNPPIIFRRYQHQLPQAVPGKDGNDIRLIDKYLRINNNDYRLLIYVFLITALIADIPHVCLILFGPQGSTKTTAFKILRKLIDPSRLSVVFMGTDRRSFIQNLEQNWFCPFDNISGLKKDLSDILCQVITGAGFCDRTLFTDDDPFIRNIRRIVGLNGINVAAVQPDLLERCILIELLPVGKNERKSEEDIWREFAVDRSKIFGAMLDLLVRAIAIKPTIVVDAKLRMADFAVWGEAIAQEMGFVAGHFTKIYEQNMGEINDQGIEGDYVAAAIREMVEAKLESMRNSSLISWPAIIDIWTGKPSDFIEELETIAKNSRIITDERDKYWPGQANAMSRHLNLIRPTLKNEGIIVTTGKRTGSGRIITVVYKNPDHEDQPESGQDETVNNPGGRYTDIDDKIDVDKIPF